MSVPEVKLLITCVYYTIWIAIISIHFILSVHNSHSYFEAITNYSQCVALGNCNCDDKREAMEKSSTTEVIVFVFAAAISGAFLNLSNLMFVIQVKDMKNLAKRAARRITISSDVKAKV